MTFCAEQKAECCARAACVQILGQEMCAAASQLTEVVIEVCGRYYSSGEVAAALPRLAAAPALRVLRLQANPLYEDCFVEVMSPGFAG